MTTCSVMDFTGYSAIQPPVLIFKHPVLTWWSHETCPNWGQKNLKALFPHPFHRVLVMAILRHFYVWHKMVIEVLWSTGGFLKMGLQKNVIIHFNRIFYYNPSSYWGGTQFPFQFSSLALVTFRSRSSKASFCKAESLKPCRGSKCSNVQMDPNGVSQKLDGYRKLLSCTRIMCKQCKHKSLIPLKTQQPMVIKCYINMYNSFINMFVWTKIFAQQDSLAPGLGEDALDDVSARAPLETARHVAERSGGTASTTEAKTSRRQSIKVQLQPSVNNLKWCALENDFDTGILSSDLTY